MSPACIFTVTVGRMLASCLSHQAVYRAAGAQHLVRLSEQLDIGLTYATSMKSYPGFDGGLGDRCGDCRNHRFIEYARLRARWARLR